MIFFWKFLYNLVVLPVLVIAGRCLSLFHPKLREGFRGRSLTLSVLTQFFRDVDREQPVYWFHAASHGEYEQVVPVIAGLKDILPGCITVVSFFSPSGYNNVRDPNIDCKIYLPLDFPWTVRRALEVVRPTKIIFAAYDIWPNLIWKARQRGIHTSLFSARFARGTTKLYPVIKSFYHSVYKSFSTIYTISEKDNVRLQRILVSRDGPLVRVLGNPRYDQVKNRSDRFTQERTESVLRRDNRIVMGSMWPEDENVIREAVVSLLAEYPDLSVLWVPHEPNPRYVEHSVALFSGLGLKTVTWSTGLKHLQNGARVIVVDTVGTLARLYWQGRIAYVGGGFSSGVHNVMEPAIARLPVFFGPRYRNSHEAEQLIENQAGFSITTSHEFYTKVKELFQNRNAFLETSFAATDVIHRNLGSATRVVRGIIRD